MTRKLFAITLILLLTGVVLAQADNSVKLKGYLIDRMCGMPAAKKTDGLETIKNHETSCALMTHCKASGYAVFSGGKLYKLDPAGNKQAFALLSDTKREKGYTVEVEGTLEGDTLKVTKIAEAPDAGQTD